jgi:hypothetical protein
MTDGPQDPPHGYLSWTNFTRPESGEATRARKRVPEIVFAHAIRSHFFSVVYEDATVASLRDDSHDYFMGDAPTEFNFNILVLLAGLAWIACLGRSKMGFTNEVVGFAVWFAIDEFLAANWVGSPYLERAAERVNSGVKGYTDNCYVFGEGSQVEVNRALVIQKAATAILRSPHSPGLAKIDRLVNERLAALDDLFECYEVVPAKDSTPL